ncbi:MAG: 4-(cytidine 5'-diphospho)-2-C-methyl-D-erythritol kinase [Candidatus Omnitrophica bacterium]|nr:4-(cytidine 5'-diphospho)-2-C-methyl-D-erythritol kinase [Candidatus Omnitrophota bacterium]
MNSLTLRSPAKVNLYLRIVGRYQNGYHKLVTVFHRLSLCDTLRLEKKESGFTLCSSGPALPSGRENLVVKAYELLKKKFPNLKGVSVNLKKRIPIGGGLGGGSSNAATFLLGMKKLYRLPITLRELVLIGKRLGADVPFFLHNLNHGIGLGRGDRIVPRPLKRKFWFLLLIDKKGLSTRKVYERLSHSRPAVSLTNIYHTVKILSSFLDEGNAVQAGRLLQNDLEAAAFCLRPSIQKKIKRLRELGIPAVGMSGSGPTVFGFFSREEEARRLHRTLPQDRRYQKVIVCHSL